MRPYQEARATEALICLEQGQDPLCEMATGTGKTAVASEVARRLMATHWQSDKRLLWMVHRIELVNQAKAALERATGMKVGLELPEHVSTNERIVVASKDTIRSPKRLERLRGQAPFAWIFTDEAHHSPGQSYETVYNAWPDARHFGFTATVDRLDKGVLRRYNARTTPYTIINGIEDGWLVPFKAKRVKVKSIDISSVGTVAGDFNQGELDAVIRAEESLHGIAQGLIRYAEGPTLVFATGRDSGQRLAEILNRYKPECARYVDGKTSPESRKYTFANFGRGYQFLVNVDVATEGTDLPSAQTVGMVRLTKSRAKFSQMLGRVARPLSGINDCDDSPVQRQAWIANSPKPYAKVLDFCGNTGRHSVVTVADVMGFDESVTKKVREQIDASDEQEDKTIDVFTALNREQASEQKRQEQKEKAEQKKEESRAAILATVTTEAKERALIGMGGLPDIPGSDAVLDLSQPATPGQVAELSRLQLPIPSGCDRRKARFLITEARAKLNLATQPQIDLIQKHRPELVRPDMTKGQAQNIIVKLIKKWKGYRGHINIRGKV